MSKLEVYYYLPNSSVYRTILDENSSVKDFLESILEDMKNYENELRFIHCVYLKNQRLNQNDLLKYYLNDLKINPLYVSNEPMTSYDYYLSNNIINLDEYECFEPLSYKDKDNLIRSYRSVHQFKAIDKKTKNRVSIIAFPKSFCELNYYFKYLRGFNTASLLYSQGIHEITKVLGFRYPLNENEKKNCKLLQIQNIDITGYIVVFEYMENGNIKSSVLDYINKSGEKNDIINPTIRSKVIYGIASTMKKIHQKGGIHRDLKIENIFLDQNYEPKISGFYEARFLTNNEMSMAIGTPIYMAPEIYDGENEDGTYDASIDVFAYGVLLYNFFSGKISRLDDRFGVLRSPQHVLLRVLKGARPVKVKEIPDHYWELIQKCWKHDPYERITFDEIVQILKNDKFALEEYGMKTNLDELHDYQKRIDHDEYIIPILLQNQIDSIKGENECLSEKIAKYESIFSFLNDNLKAKNCFIGQYDEEYHQIVSKIGEGATSVVYKVIDKRTNQIMCKKILKYCQNPDISFKILQNTMKEFSVLYELHHPCICKIIGINTSERIIDPNINSDDTTKDITTVALFLEFQNYSINEFLKIMDNTLKTKIIVEIAHAMNFIHKKGLIHRDLKIDNIRLNSIFEAKIIDFGLVRIHECLSENYSFVSESMTKGVGTLAYMSHEMINEEDYDYKTDIYSFGIVLYVIFVGSLPLQSMRDKMMGKKIHLPEPSSSISKVCIDIISKCLSSNPSERPSFDDILKYLRDNSFFLADFVDQKIISKRDLELQLF